MSRRPAVTENGREEHCASLDVNGCVHGLRLVDVRVNREAAVSEEASLLDMIGDCYARGRRGVGNEEVGREPSNSGNIN